MDKKIKKVGPKISLLRKEKNMTAEELARAMGVSNTTIYSWEKSRKMPSLENIFLLSRSLEVSIGELLGEQEFTVSKMSPEEKLAYGEKIVTEAKLELENEELQYENLAEKLYCELVTHASSQIATVPEDEMKRSLVGILKTLEEMGEKDRIDRIR